MHQTPHPGTRAVLYQLCREDMPALHQATQDAAGRWLTGLLGNIVQAGLRRDGQIARGH
ncbi:hypothetical protein [Chitinimonas prasina]|uniref:hypothetical protein n=1 Tax=Chitinimonas prasina TaxID=1434937 RepID=UPI0024E0A505|nr:hypothetical protein [Chitinimonas prasina]